MWEMFNLKKTLRKIGLFFLQKGGVDVPEEYIDSVFTPYVLELRSEIASNASAQEFEEILKKQKVKLCLSTDPFIMSNVKRGKDITTVTLKLLIQKPLS